MNRSLIGEFLGDRKEFNQLVDKYFFTYFSFYNQLVDDSFRKVLFKTRLPKESQGIERMIKCFANCYWDQNKDRMLQSSPLWTEVMILDLAWMILALNTKNHSSQVAQ